MDCSKNKDILSLRTGQKSITKKSLRTGSYTSFIFREQIGRQKILSTEWLQALPQTLSALNLANVN
jgi:hypothetical protein